MAVCRSKAARPIVTLPTHCRRTEVELDRRKADCCRLHCPGLTPQTTLSQNSGDDVTGCMVPSRQAVIAHDLDAITAVDWVIAFGPDGGVKGGADVGDRTPEVLVGSARSHTRRHSSQCWRAVDPGAGVYNCPSSSALAASLNCRLSICSRTRSNELLLKSR